MAKESTENSTSSEQSTIEREHHRPANFQTCRRCGCGRGAWQRRRPCRCCRRRDDWRHCGQISGHGAADWRYREKSDWFARRPSRSKARRSRVLRRRRRKPAASKKRRKLARRSAARERQKQKPAKRAVLAVHDRRNRVAVAKPKSVAHRAKQATVVRNRPHVLDVPRKSDTRRNSKRRASHPSNDLGRAGFEPAKV